jgi:hypothetical protein
MDMTLEKLIKIEDAALMAWSAVKDTMGMERYESDEYKAYQAAVKAVNKAVTKKNMGY